MIDLLCCLGLHWIIKYGTILNFVRTPLKRVKILKELLECSLCLGFWCGVIVAIVSNDWRICFASAAVCWLMDNINNMIQSVEIKLDNHD